MAMWLTSMPVPLKEPDSSKQLLRSAARTPRGFLSNFNEIVFELLKKMEGEIKGGREAGSDGERREKIRTEERRGDKTRPIGREEHMNQQPIFLSKSPLGNMKIKWMS